MRPVLFTIVLLATSTAFAQTDKTQQAQIDKSEQQARAQLERIVNNACPVGIIARQQGSPVTTWTISLDDLNPGKPLPEKAKNGSGVHVDLNAPHKEIKQADLKVFYLPPGTRVLPIAGSQFTSSTNPAPEAHKNFVLTSGSATPRLHGDLLLGPVASVTHITLTHITYSDGTEWTAPTSNSCSVEPSHFMLVDTK